MKLTLPTDSADRKNYPVNDGPLSYFPAAFAGVAHVCKLGNDKHNPGEPLHHARGKSGDHANCIVRHLMDVNDMRAYLDRGGDDCAITHLLHEVNQLAWRALALSQELHEAYGDAPLAPGARLPEPPVSLTDVLLPQMPFVRCNRTVDKGAYRCERYIDHEGPCGSNEAERAQAVPAGTDTVVDSVIAQITGGASPETSAAMERATFPPVSRVSSAHPSLWETDSRTWYFNRDDFSETMASKREYPSEAAARAAYWADKDAG